MKAWIRDYEFYLKNKDKFYFFGGYLPDLIESPDGVKAMKAFKIWDSQGKIIPCCEIELLKEVIACKKSVNWHIKHWVEGYHIMFMGIYEYIQEFIDPPAWVEVSFRKQLAKYKISDYAEEELKDFAKALIKEGKPHIHR